MVRSGSSGSGVRIIAGRHRGRRLRTRPGLDTRPTADRVKEALFSMLQDQIPGAVVVDAFAGNGALGIEALSRGAVRVFFVEREAAAREVIRQNLEELGESERARVLGADALCPGSWGIGEPVDVVLADPPYRKGLLERFLEAFGAEGQLAEDGILAVEHEKGLRPEPGRLVCLRTRPYGETEISLWGAVPRNAAG